MASGRRIERVSHLLREELAHLIGTEVKDPRIASVTVTGVDVSHDISHAVVYVRTLGGATPVDEAIEGLTGATGFLRGRLGRALRMRRVPDLEFRADRTLERALRIESLLREVRRQEGGDEARRP